LNENTKYNYYRTGVSASQGFGDHNFIIAVTNSTNAATDTSATSANNNGLAYSAAYNGSFLDNMIQPIVSFTQFQIDGDPDVGANFANSVNDTLMAAGVRVQPVSGLCVDVDYENLNQPINNSLTQSNTQVTTTFHAQANYQIKVTDTATLVPVVNFISDKFTGYGTIALPNASNFTKTSYDAGVMYYPLKDTNFRYELVYSYATQSNDSSNASVSGINTTNIRLGAKMDL
jgi:hypothetical protein